MAKGSWVCVGRRQPEVSIPKVLLAFIFRSLIDTFAYRETVVKFRKKCAKVAKRKLVFIDATGMRAEPRPKRGLAAPGKAARVKASRAESYEPRVDFVGAIGIKGPLAAMAMTSSDRKEENIKGIRKPQMKRFLRDELAPNLVDNAIVVLDKGLNFKVDEVKDALAEGGADDVEDVWILPTGTAKHVSPLDNCLWHELKEKVRKKSPGDEDETAKVMEDLFMKLSGKQVERHFHHCALTSRSDPYKGLDDQ